MIKVIVGTNHVHDILTPHREHPFNAALQALLAPLRGRPVFEVGSVNDLAGHTVYEALKEFHGRLKERLLGDQNEILRARKEEIERVAREEYHCGDLLVENEDVVRSLAIQDVFPHGSLPGDPVRVSAYLPDLSIGTRCYGFFADLNIPTADLTNLRKRLPDGYIECQSCSNKAREVYLAGNRDNRGHNCKFCEKLRQRQQLLAINLLECHLCDSVQAVYQRTVNYRDELYNETTGSCPFHSLISARLFPRDSGDEYLVIDAAVLGFVGHRSLRSDNPEVPAIGTHRLFAAAALRQGVAKPFISRLFPINLWRGFTEPTRHFLLDAAEKAGAIACPPMYPNMPSEQQMAKVTHAAEMAQGDCGFDDDSCLRRLGIAQAVERRRGQYVDRLENAQPAWDWTRAIAEYQAALYEGDIEQSLRLQATLDLYALHKRVLSMVENVIAPKLKERAKQVKRSLKPKCRITAFWSHAFKGWTNDKGGHEHGLLEHDLPPNLDDTATLEIHGHWLIKAQAGLDAGPPRPFPQDCLDLADLLDEMMGELGKAYPISGLNISLVPADPAEHVKRVERVGEKRNEAAAALTLCLGKLVIALRNYIEHGHDEVVDGRLLVHGEHYWREPWDGKERFQTLINKAKNVNKPWRFADKLPSNDPKDLPPPAKGLFLSPASLLRCLVLMSLVLGASFSHFDLN